MSKYSDQVMLWLKELGYTHCFFLAGGGSMHLLDSASRYFRCTPFVHEVSAAIATEYFNECSTSSEKAFCLVTTGPGLTNTVTAISGAWLESHELLILAGQVKTEDLASGGIRQRGIQELPGIEIVKPISKSVMRIDKTVNESTFKNVVTYGSIDRKGPVVIEICIDVSATPSDEKLNDGGATERKRHIARGKFEKQLISLIEDSERPLILLGSGISREVASLFLERMQNLGVPVASTWSGADRVPSTYRYYAGRPNTFGMRWANIYQQQCDLLIAVGARLGLQQTGFNWREFCPVGKVVMIDIDQSELLKGHPDLALGIQADVNEFALELANILEMHLGKAEDWVNFLDEIKYELPVIEDCHSVPHPYVDPYKFIQFIGSISLPTDIFTPGTSGGTHTAFFQSFYNKPGQKIIPNKGLASMGYGMAGAIGAALANPSSRVIDFEGDGSFSQNTQELATIARNNLNIKLFVTSNEGYASIRTSQISYFKSNYLGCDTKSGLGFPNLQKLAEAYGVGYLLVDDTNKSSEELIGLFDSRGPILFEVKSDPSQLYLPKITSSINTKGVMVSNPLHIMSPELPEQVAMKVLKFIPNKG